MLFCSCCSSMSWPLACHRCPSRRRAYHCSSRLPSAPSCHSCDKCCSSSHHSAFSCPHHCCCPFLSDWLGRPSQMMTVMPLAYLRSPGRPSAPSPPSSDEREA